jgi:putative endonuclease
MNTKSKGNLSESIVCDFLVSKGYKIADRNYFRRWGELDIVAIKEGSIHFIEVKSDFRENRNDGYRAEELMHNLKQRRLRRMVATYLEDKKYGLDHPFVFDLAIVNFGKMLDNSGQTTGKSGFYSVSIQENVII